MTAVAVGGPAAAHPTTGPYRWVAPPPDHVRGNQRPTGFDRAAVPGPPGGQTAIWTSDLQFVVSLATDALPSPDVRVDVDPVDPDAVAPLPGASPNGNAYRVRLFEGGERVALRDCATCASHVYLIVPYPAMGVLHSVDGQRWRWVNTAEVLDDGRWLVPFRGVGWYLAAEVPIAAAPERPGPPPYVVAGVGVVAAAGVVGIRRARRRGSPPSPPDAP